MAFVKAQPFKPQFDDGSGNLLSGGTVEFQDWDTSTPINYYTDENGVSGGTSLTLDSRGEPTNDIFYDDQKDYKVILKDSAGATIDTLGPFRATSGTQGSAWKLFSGTPTQTSATTFTLTGDQTSTFTVGARLQLTDSSTLYGIITASVYTSVTTVTVKLDTGSLSGSLSAVYTGISTTAGKEISAATISYLNTDIAASVIYDLESLLNTYPVSVLMLGAVVGGDLYQALTNTQTYNIAHAIIPAGDFTLSATWVINKAFRLDGAGSCSANEANAGGQPGTSTTRITCTGTSINGIEILGDGTEGVENVHLSNFSLWGTADMNDGIQLGTGVLVTKSSLTNVHVRGFTRTGKFGIRLNRVLEFLLDNVYTQSNYYGWGNLSGDVCTTMRSTQVHSRTNTVNGVFIGGGFTGCAMTGVLCEGNGEAGIVINGTNVTGNAFYGYYSEANNAVGIGAGTALAPIIIGTGAFNISDVYFYNAKMDDDATNDFGGRSVYLNNANKIVFQDCEFTTYNTNFIECTTSTSDCVFRTAVPTVSDINVAGNNIAFNGRPAVTVVSQVPNMKMGTITRDISAVDGAVNETGLGFLPKSIQFYAAVDNTEMFSVGMSDGSSQLSVHDTNGVTANSYGVVTGSIILRTAAGTYTTGTITIDTIGQFTITWAKTGTPTGTAKIFYTAFG